MQKLIEKYNFQTGDILLFSHIKQYNGFKDYLFNFIDSMIQYFTKSKYNHVGIIVKDPCWNKKLKGYYLLESNIEPIPDVEDNKKKVGVQLIPLEFVLKEKYNNLYVRKLICKRDDEFNSKLIEIHSIIHNKPYDFNIIDWLNAGIHNQKCKKKTNTFWCSALVSFIYSKLGFINKDINWSVISPEQLGTEHKDCLQFQNCKVEKEQLIENN